MRRSVITLFLLLATVSSAQELSTQKGFLRATVAKLEEPDRGALLELLDRGRAASDAVVATLLSGKREGVAKELKGAVLDQWNATARALAPERAGESATTLEYRNQAIEFRTTPAATDVTTTRTWYACVYASSSGSSEFVSVVLFEEDDGRQTVLAIESARYVTGTPAFLLSKDAAADGDASH